LKQVLKKTIYKKGSCHLPYWVNAEGNGPWIVFLHGPCVDRRSFDGLLSECKDGPKVLFCDLRGHGNSEGNDETITFPLLVEDVMSILADANISQAIFVGQSIGGAIAQHIAKQYPDMVLGLGLIGISCITATPTFFESFFGRIMGFLLKRYKQNRIVRNCARSYSATPKGQEYVGRCVAKMNKQDILDTLLNASLKWTQKDKAYVTNIPAFVAVGTRDPLSVVKRAFKVYEKTMPNADVFKITNAATLVQWDQPKRIAELIDRLLLKIYDTEGYDRAMASYREEVERKLAVQDGEQDPEEELLDALDREAPQNASE